LEDALTRFVRFRLGEGASYTKSGYLVGVTLEVLARKRVKIEFESLLAELFVNGRREGTEADTNVAVSH